mmetsp:Transcript_22835/g.46508  ORF Transcript_22835/g.46508 Transcript_22835/m.46508 type:complete len:88 (-) Transcript_22835:233-496(-)|eukprot:CAMPEP_0119057074 /NCGR_PEP_ID=MMETSP1178-20130426/1601_1 /TAXON_ID=33656 /ORGANISM="unid sp, Strain CCMP2000" /LENGTH=87 /DNA_ID=CAMNT_0007037871 /DNA_START=30 /DNA_END=293 /DNA_ORIENTATION=+
MAPTDVQASEERQTKVKTSGFTYQETYELYNQQLHYAKAHYTTPQLNAWQTDWNKYFVRHSMDIPVYAHKISKARSKASQGPMPLEA